MRGIGLPIYYIDHYIASIIKAVWYWVSNRHTDQWKKKKEIPGTGPTKDAQKAYCWQRWQRCGATQWRNEGFSTNGAGVIEYAWGKQWTLTLVSYFTQILTLSES